MLDQYRKMDMAENSIDVYVPNKDAERQMGCLFPAGKAICEADGEGKLRLILS